jgi:sporulation integral membrane protein YtvI
MAFIHQLPPPFADRLNDFNIDLGSTIQAFLGSVSSMGINLVSNITGHVPSFFIAFVFTIMLSFFISVQYDKVTLFIKDQLPQKAKKIISDLKRIVNDIILRYIKAMVKLMFITFVELAIGLLLIQRSATAIPIAAGIAIFDALPFFGTGAIMIPWVIVELIQGNFTAALGLGILYAIVTVIRNIIEPHIVGKKLGLNPIVSIVSIYLGFKIMGVLGMIFMPIIVQIIIELHNMGAIKIFRERKQNKAEVEAEQKASEADYTAEEP